jgi:hypothetical protein
MHPSRQLLSNPLTPSLDCQLVLDFPGYVSVDISHQNRVVTYLWGSETNSSCHYLVNTIKVRSKPTISFLDGGKHGLPGDT